MQGSKESIEKIAAYYRNYASIFKKEGTCTNKGEAYSMHIGYRGDNNFPGQNESASELMEKKLIKDANVQNGQQILDAGCGTGTLGFEITSLYPNTRVYGIDLLDDHLKIAYQQKANFPAIFFSKQDYLNLAFKDNSFDRIFFCESLIHAQDKSKLLFEAYRVLKPGGKIIIADIFMLDDRLSEKDQQGLSELSKEIGIPNLENFYTFILRLIQLNFRNILCQNITNSIASTIPVNSSNLEQETSTLHNPPIESAILLKLSGLLSIVGNLFVKNNAGYFIITADVPK